MRITIERKIRKGVGEKLLAIYKESFAPLETLAAGRQALDDAGFRAQLTDESVLKFVSWDRDGKPCGLALVATDLSTIPWISPAYFAKRFPEHFRRQAIYYFDALAVAPGRQGGIWAYALLRELVRMVAENRGVAAFDCCQFNEETIDVPKMVAAVGERFCHFEAHHIDTQRYYAYVASGLRAEQDTEIDLREPAPDLAGDEDVDIDLVELERAEQDRTSTHQRDG